MIFFFFQSLFGTLPGWRGGPAWTGALRFRVGAVLEHLGTVGALEHDPVAFAQEAVHVGGDYPRVRAVAKREVSLRDDEPAGLGSIVGGGEGFDFQIPDTERFAVTAGVVKEGFGASPAEVEEVGKGPCRCMDRDIQFPAKDVHAPGMVHVLVGEEQGIDPAHVNPGPLHAEKDLFCAQAAVDQNRAAAPFQDNTVALAPAGKHGTAHILYLFVVLVLEDLTRTIRAWTGDKLIG
jgi:hypothetical protein